MQVLWLPSPLEDILGIRRERKGNVETCSENSICMLTEGQDGCSFLISNERRLSFLDGYESRITIEVESE